MLRPYNGSQPGMAVPLVREWWCCHWLRLLVGVWLG